MYDTLEKETLSPSETLIHIENNKVWIQLNRPKALNALSFQMMNDLLKTLIKWEKNKDLEAIIIEGSTPRAFCAGGDLRGVFEAQKRKDASFLHELFKVEYLFNIHLFYFPKPYISLLHGFTMGGGAGASVHGSHRIVCENVTFSMPETGIGYFPDVGASYFLNQCPGSLGLYLGLTGIHITAPDMLFAGFGTHFIPLEKWDALKAALKTSRDIEDVINAFSQKPEKAPLQRLEDEINTLFSYDSLEAIIERLKSCDSSFAKGTLSLLNSRSPTSLKVTFEQLKRTKGEHDFRKIMNSEFLLSRSFVEDHDFHEGIRAAIIDKDRTPQWSPSRLEDVTQEHLDTYFKNREDGILV